MCAVQILDKISQDEIEWKRQFDEFMIETDRRSLEQFYKDKGMEIGLAEGREQGIKQGLEQSKIEIAKRLISMGLPFEQIVQGTDLPLEKIQELAKEV